jgi:hypothetical protein
MECTGNGNSFKEKLNIELIGLIPRPLLPWEKGCKKMIINKKPSPPGEGLGRGQNIKM